MIPALYTYTMYRGDAATLAKNGGTVHFSVLGFMPGNHVSIHFQFHGRDLRHTITIEPMLVRDIAAVQRDMDAYQHLAAALEKAAFLVISVEALVNRE